MPAKINVAIKPMIQMYQAGWSTQNIAVKAGVSDSLVCRRLKAAGVRIRTNSEAQILTYKKGREKTRYWKGKKVPPAIVERRAAGQRGEKHYLWKGGQSIRRYRGKVKKESCEVCKGRLNLGIHHKDFDHYNNDPTNLQVLCLFCHMSLHKKAYWDAKKAGKVPPKSNGPLGWNR